MPWGYCPSQAQQSAADGISEARFFTRRTRNRWRLVSAVSAFHGGSCQDRNPTTRTVLNAAGGLHRAHANGHPRRALTPPAPLARTQAGSPPRNRGPERLASKGIIMTKYVLSAEDHAESLSVIARFERCFADKQARLEATSCMTEEDRLELSHDRARIELIREQVAHLASGQATKEDEQRYTKIVLMHVQQLSDLNERLRYERQILEGVVALHELGCEDDELVTVN